MNLPFAIAAVLALFGAAIHGIVGERLVVSRLRRESLAPTKFGGPSMTMLMIRVTWHVVTLVFVVVGGALAVCTPAGSGEACAGVGRVAAISYLSFSALAFLLSFASHGSRATRLLVRHPGPIVFLGVAGLSWWGSTI